jgi:hypothetical protein
MAGRDEFVSADDRVLHQHSSRRAPECRRMLRIRNGLPRHGVSRFSATRMLPPLGAGRAGRG